MMFSDAIVVNGPLNLNSKEHLLQEHSHAKFGPPGLMALPEPSSDNEGRKIARKKQKRRLSREPGEDGDDRTREHPFIVTEPGEVARGKKNGLDYLFDLYEQCARFLDEVQQISRERGEKCPTKVTNQVFRHAKLKGASYINKPKMRHYVHCYALHCLDREKSNYLRKLFKERGENVGAWRQACYYPLVDMARENGWDIEGVFIRNEKLRIWYVPTKLRQLCHLEKSKDSDSCSYE
nr:LEAFY 3 [Anemia villosa]